MDGYSVVAEQTNLFLLIAALFSLAWLDRALRRFWNLLTLRNAYLKRSIVKVNYLGEQLSQLEAISRTHFSSIRAEVDPVACSIVDAPFSLADELSFFKTDSGTLGVRISVETRVRCCVQILVASHHHHVLSSVVELFEAASGVNEVDTDMGGIARALSSRIAERTPGRFLAVSTPAIVEAATKFDGTFDVASAFVGKRYDHLAQHSTSSVAIVLRPGVAKDVADSNEYGAPKQSTGLVGHVTIVKVRSGISELGEPREGHQDRDLRVATGKDILNVTSDVAGGAR